MEVNHREQAYSWMAETVAVCIGVTILLWLLSADGVSSTDLIIVSIAWLVAGVVITISLFKKVDTLILQRIAVHVEGYDDE